GELYRRQTSLLGLRTIKKMPATRARMSRATISSIYCYLPTVTYSSYCWYVAESIIYPSCPPMVCGMTQKGVRRHAVAGGHSNRRWTLPGAIPWKMPCFLHICEHFAHK